MWFLGLIDLHQFAWQPWFYIPMIAPFIPKIYTYPIFCRRDQSISCYIHLYMAMMDQYLQTTIFWGWPSINPSYFDVNYRGTRFWSIPRFQFKSQCLHSVTHSPLVISPIRWKCCIHHLRILILLINHHTSSKSNRNGYNYIAIILRYSKSNN